MADLAQQTQPRLHRAGGGVDVDVAIGDPSVTIIEIGDEFGLLLSETSDRDDLDGGITLHDVLWTATRPTAGFLARLAGTPPAVLRRPLDDVRLYRHDVGLFVAEDLDSGSYLPQPSAEPYVVVFVSTGQFEELRDRILAEHLDALLDGLGLILDGIPGFTIDGDALIGPTTYAHGVDASLVPRIVDI